MNTQQIISYPFRTLKQNFDNHRYFQETWYWPGKQFTALYARMMFGMDVLYKHPIPAGAKILASNHPATIDPIIMTTLVPEPVCVLIIDTFFKIPIIGLSLRMAGHIRVDMKNGKPSLEEGIRYLKNGRTIGIFPEGEISPLSGGFNRPHTGVARLALSTGAPVIPVGVSLDTDYIRQLPSTVDGETRMASWYAFGPYALTVGEPMFFQGDPDDRELVRSVCDQVMARIATLSHEGAQRMRSACQARVFFPLRLLGIAQFVEI